MVNLSRSKLELLTECPRCFWLNVKKKIPRPSGFPFTINNAIDFLLKQEFDAHRSSGTAHAIMKAYNIDAVPYSSPLMDSWRHNFTGIQVEHKETDFLVFGAVDDIWLNSKNELIVVDYKATGSKEHHIYDSYKRQLEIYQWLLKSLGYKVSPTGYFLFARVNKEGGFSNNGVNHKYLSPPNSKSFGSLSFDIFLEPCEGDNAWVPNAIFEARKVYDLDSPPLKGAECEYCRYVEAQKFDPAPKKSATPRSGHPQKLL